MKDMRTAKIELETNLMEIISKFNDTYGFVTTKVTLKYENCPLGKALIDVKLTVDF